MVRILSPFNNGDWMVCMHLSKGELELMEHEASHVFSHLMRASIFYGVFFFFFYGFFFSNLIIIIFWRNLNFGFR